jgi:hypothetical protein
MFAKGAVYLPGNAEVNVKIGPKCGLPLRKSGGKRRGDWEEMEREKEGG